MRSAILLCQLVLFGLSSALLVGRPAHLPLLQQDMAEDPYAFNAPQYADLASEAKAGGAMSPATHAWFGAPSPLASSR